MAKESAGFFSQQKNTVLEETGGIGVFRYIQEHSLQALEHGEGEGLVSIIKKPLFCHGSLQ